MLWIFPALPDEGSPEPSGIIGIEDRVVAHDGQILRLALRDQHAVKRVLMWAWQKPGSNPVFHGNGQLLKSFTCEAACEARCQFFRTRKFHGRSNVLRPRSSTVDRLFWTHARFRLPLRAPTGDFAILCVIYSGSCLSDSSMRARNREHPAAHQKIDADQETNRRSRWAQRDSRKQTSRSQKARH